jgi:ribonuclease-3
VSCRRRPSTHSSYAAENAVESNERLEFLGDAVVDLVIADAIITNYPDLDQGTGSLTRSRVVNEASLAAAARRLSLGDLVRMGRGEAKSGGAERPGLLADAFEAVVAAVYLEHGYEPAKSFVLGLLAEDLDRAAQSPGDVDPKSKLRQWCESRGVAVPTYAVDGEGPSHARQYVATVTVRSVTFVGRGPSKKAAEVAAAEAALEEVGRA